MSSPKIFTDGMYDERIWGVLGTTTTKIIFKNLITLLLTGSPFLASDCPKEYIQTLGS